MKNSNYDRLYNLPLQQTHKRHIDWENVAAWIFIIIALLSFSLVSYDIWSAIYEWIG